MALYKSFTYLLTYLKNILTRFCYAQIHVMFKAHILDAYHQETEKMITEHSTGVSIKAKIYYKLQYSLFKNKIR